MSWVKKITTNTNAAKPGTYSSSSYLKDFDLSACYDSFKKHWQQIQDIVKRCQIENASEPKHDDILTIENHLKQILTLIQVELRSDVIVTSCIEYLLNENLLEQLCSWTVNCNKYDNSLRVEQLRIYEVLLTSLHKRLLDRVQFSRPLIRLLNSFNGDCLPADIEKRLVIMINQLCSSFSQHSELLDMFFPVTGDECINRNGKVRLDIFSLLVQFVQRDGMIGEQARDSLLLCMSLSKNNGKIARYITEESDICPVLAAVLNGFYSLLPRKLTIESADWFRFAADDVYEIKELTDFMNSLEFCNVVYQVCHPKIKAQLFDYIYQGFLVMVMGPALLQEYMASDECSHTSLQLSTEEELVAATAYFELFIRSVTHPGLLHAFVKFLLKETVDDQRVIDCFIERINYNSKLCVVTISLLETLLDLNCEDIMLELILKHLIPCTHVMHSQRSKIQQINPYCGSVDELLSLTINLPVSNNKNYETNVADDYLYLKHARIRIQNCTKATMGWTYPYDGEIPPQTGSAFIHEEFMKQTCDIDFEHNSLPSADDGSSGYESFKTFRDNDRLTESSENGALDERRTNPPSPCGSEDALEYCTDFPKTIVSKLNNNNVKKLSAESFAATPSIGPFLSTIFKKLENILLFDFHTMLRLTGLISRLAIYPQPLISSVLLDHTLVFQPSVKSLFQVLRLLKQLIESRLSNVKDLPTAVSEAEQFLTERLDNLSNSRKRQTSESSSLPIMDSSSEPFKRGESKRKSLSVAFGSMFRRNSAQHEQLEHVGNGAYRYMKGDKGKVRNLMLCAIIMNEWLKELAAITQEHWYWENKLIYYNKSVDIQSFWNR